MILMSFLMALKPVFNLYYLAPQLVMTTSISSMSILINPSYLQNNLFLLDKFRRLLISCSLGIFIFGYLFIKPSFVEALTSLDQFPKNSIIWSDSIGSKLYYYHNINIGKLHFGSKDAQREIIEYLSNNNINQFVLDESNQVSIFKSVASGSLREFSMYNNLKLLKYIPE